MFVLPDRVTVGLPALSHLSRGGWVCVRPWACGRTGTQSIIPTFPYLLSEEGRVRWELFGDALYLGFELILLRRRLGLLWVFVIWLLLRAV